MHDLENILLKMRTGGGDTFAFQQLYEILYPDLKRFLHYFDISEFIVEDIISDVFMNLWIRRDRLGDIKDIKSYLLTCAKNRMLRYNKSIRLKERIPISDLRVREMPAAAEDNIDYDMEKKQTHEIIRSCIDRLPERCRLTYTLIKYERMTYSEVARLMSVSERTVQAQMIIAVKKIGTEIREKFGREDI